MDRSTDELLKILQSKKSYNEFFQEEVGELEFKTTAEYLDMLRQEKGLSKNVIIKRSNMDRNYAYQILNGTKSNPSRDKILMLAIGMELSLNETRKLLKVSELSDLYVRNPRDSIIMFCIDKHDSVIATNECLQSFGVDILE